MLYFSTSKKISLLIICLLGCFLALPNFWSTGIPFLPKQTINLGLDLRGGSYLLLEVDGSEKPGAFEFSFIVNIYFFPISLANPLKGTNNILN